MFNYLLIMKHPGHHYQPQVGERRKRDSLRVSLFVPFPCDLRLAIIFLLSSLLPLSHLVQVTETEFLRREGFSVPHMLVLKWSQSDRS